MISNDEIRAAVETEWHKTGADSFLDRAAAAVWALLEHHETQEQIEPMEITVIVKKRGKHLVTATHTLDTLAPRGDY